MKQYLNTDKVKCGLREAILLLCKTGLSFESEICIEGLLGITLDQKEVFLVNIRETISNPMDLHVSSSEENKTRIDNMVMNSNRAIEQTLEHELILEEQDLDDTMIIKEEIYDSDDSMDQVLSKHTVIDKFARAPPIPINLSLQTSSSTNKYPIYNKLLMPSPKDVMPSTITSMSQLYALATDPIMSQDTHLPMLNESYDESNERKKWMTAMSRHFKPHSRHTDPIRYQLMANQQSNSLDMMASSLKNCLQTPIKAPPNECLTSSRKRQSSQNFSECVNCGTNTTTLWRRSVDGESICNACGLYYKLHQVHRPLSLATGEIHSRRRRKEKNPQEADIKASLDLSLYQASIATLPTFPVAVAEPMKAPQPKLEAPPRPTPPITTTTNNVDSVPADTQTTDLLSSSEYLNTIFTDTYAVNTGKEKP